MSNAGESLLYGLLVLVGALVGAYVQKSSTEDILKPKTEHPNPAVSVQETSSTGQYEFTDNSNLWTKVRYRIEQKTIDSCEYIIIFGENSRSIIHKANCKNNSFPTHLNR